MAQLLRAFISILAVILVTEASANTTTDALINTSHVPTNEATTPTTAVPDLPPYICMIYSPEDQHSCDVLWDKRQVWKRIPFCLCDPLCMTYGDCCPDYKGSIATTVSMTTEEDHHPNDKEAGMSLDDLTRCVQTIEFDQNEHQPRSGHYMVALCPQDWSGDSAIRQLCQEVAGADRLATIPVQGTNGRNYKNLYCALCHGLPIRNATFWSVRFSEKSENLASFNASHVLKMAREIGPNEIFSWTFDPPSYPDVEKVAPDLASSLRACAIVDANPCPMSENHDTCNRFHAPIALNGTTYKNFACAQCKISLPITVPWEEWCNGPSGGIEGLGPDLSMATLLIFADHTDIDGVQENGAIGTTECQDNQIFDPFINLCRDLSCPHGFALENGATCKPIKLQDRAAITYLEREATVDGALTVTGRLLDNFGAKTLNVDDTWEAVAHKAAGDFQSFVSACNKQEDVDFRRINQGNNTCDDLTLTWTCAMGAAILIPTEDCGTGSVFSCSVNMSFNGTAPSVDGITDEQNALLGRCLQGSFWSYTVQLEYFTISTPCGMTWNDTDQSMNGSDDRLVSTAKRAFLWDSHSGHFEMSVNESCQGLDCPLLTLSADEYVMTGALNDSIRLTQNDRVLVKGEFKLKENGEAEVCNFLPSTTSLPGVASGMWDYAHFILTISGSILSLIGLVATTATYVSFPTLRRNAAGKSLLCLVVTLGFAQMTMLIGLQRTDVITLCVAFAIGSHFFWLSAFCWMNVLAIDIYRTFGIGTKINDPNTRSFRYYAVYGLGAPALIVGTCAILSFCDCVDVDVHYASELACWIGNGMTNLLAFGVPIIAILCSNVVLFSLSVAGVMKTRRASKRMNITQGQGDAASKSRADLILYLKLTAIMGFTWIFGFIASFSGVQFFWYPFIVLSSLQGALVCLAFVCNQRVIAMWKAKLMDTHDQQSRSISLSVRRPQASNLTSTTEMSAAVNNANLTKV